MQNNESHKKTRKVPTNKRNELRIDEILAEKGMQYKELAALMGKDYSQIYKMLRSNPNLNTLVWVADVLGVCVRDLFVGPKEESNEHVSEESVTCSAHPQPQHAENVEFDGVHYKVCKCPKCGMIFEVKIED